MKIWLDDLRLPPATDWLWARDKDDFVALIEEFGLPSEISFDHDLGINLEGGDAEQEAGINEWYMLASPKETGYDCAKWLIDCHQDVYDGGSYEDWVVIFPKWRVHSANPVGAENITKLLENYEKHIKG